MAQRARLSKAEVVAMYSGIAGLVISVVSLYISYAGSPLSTLGRATVTYRLHAGVVVSEERDCIWRTSCEVSNESRVTAEDVVVTVRVPESDIVPVVEVLGDLEYAVLRQDAKSATVKFPLLPAGALAVVLAHKHMDPADAMLPQPSVIPFMLWATVSHRHGMGLQE